MDKLYNEGVEFEKNRILRLGKGAWNEEIVMSLSEFLIQILFDRTILAKNSMLSSHVFDDIMIRS